MKTFTSQGFQLAYRDMPGDEAMSPGHGEAIFLVHGFASTHAVNWVNTLWTKTLTHRGFRVLALDMRGHGLSAKSYVAADYAPPAMAGDVIALMDHLGIAAAPIMGYSMGARVAAFAAALYPDRVKACILGGLGAHLVADRGLPAGIAEAMEVENPAAIDDPVAAAFRRFAEANFQDLRAMAACMRGSRQALPQDFARRIVCPVLVAVGTKDEIAGEAAPLLDLIPKARAFAILNRDHNLAVGDRSFKAAVVEFLGEVLMAPRT